MSSGSEGRRYYNGVWCALTPRCGGRFAAAAVLWSIATAAAAQPSPASALDPVTAASRLALLTGGTLDVRWISPEGLAVAAPPVLDESTAYVPATGRGLIAYDLDSGRTRWVADGETRWAPTVGGGLVFVAMTGGLRAFEATSGRVVWQRTLPAPASAPPYWDTGWLLISVEGGDLVAFRAADGELLWQAPLGAAAAVAPVPALDALVLGLADGRVVSLDLATGGQNWVRQLEGAATGLRALDDQLLVGSSARAMYSLDLQNGRTRWRWRVGGPVVGVAAADDDHVYFVAFDHLLRAVDRGSGNLRWRQALPHRPAGSPVVIGTTVLVPSLAAEISTYDAATGKPGVKIASAGEVGSETHVRPGGPVAGTRLVAVSVEGRVVAFAPRIEPATAPLADRPGAPVTEPAPQAAATPTPSRDRR
jgi:outer membrane protein assembly factor BamB